MAAAIEAARVAAIKPSSRHVQGDRALPGTSLSASELAGRYNGWSGRFIRDRRAGTMRHGSALPFGVRLTSC